MSGTDKKIPCYRRWNLTEDEQIEFKSLTSETLKGALEVIKKSYLVNENICMAVKIHTEPGASKEFEDLCLSAAKDGLSVVAVDLNTKEVIGVSFNKILGPGHNSSFFEHFGSNCKYNSSKTYMDLKMKAHSKINLLKHYNVNCVLEILTVAILPAYRQRRIAEQLITSTIEICKELVRGKNVKIPVMIHGNDEVTNGEMMPSVISAVPTNNYALNIAKKCGFEERGEIRYDKVEFDGEKLSERVGKKHQKLTLVEKYITI